MKNLKVCMVKSFVLHRVLVGRPRGENEVAQCPYQSSSYCKWGYQNALQVQTWENHSRFFHLPFWNCLLLSVSHTQFPSFFLVALFYLILSSGIIPGCCLMDCIWRNVSSKALPFHFCTQPLLPDHFQRGVDAALAHWRQLDLTQLKCRKACSEPYIFYTRENGRLPSWN